MAKRPHDYQGGSPPKRSKKEAKADHRVQDTNSADGKLPPLPKLPEDLKKAVFTHSSKSGRDERNYEQLEFLGDAYVGMFAAKLIFQRFPRMPVKQQSSLRERMARNRTFADYSRGYGFEDSLNVDHFTTVNEKVLGDVFEAYVAAVVLSDPVHGVSIAEGWLAALWTPLLSDAGVFFTPAERQGLDMEAKQKLNALLWSKPVRIDYHQDKLRPADHDGFDQDQKTRIVRYTVSVRWEQETSVTVGSAVGVGKKEASMLAAQDALTRAESGPVKELAERKRIHDLKRKSEMNNARNTG